ncbi:MAG: YdiU family protein [Verrucomicrobiota bacterium]|nr:YdiU family protein [Verrucomicrobiota bacterium]
MNICGFNFDNTYTNLPNNLFSIANPVKLPAHSPKKIVIINNELASSVGLDFSSLNNEEQADLFSGQQIPKDSTPFSQAYAGHQFGHFTILGDGRAHILGEHLSPDGKRYDIQFKGSGQTPYSRRGDGKAVLGPMLREYIISEAMHYFGIPSTRSLAVVATGESVRRETNLPGAILTRLASSHIRIGTFEFAAATGNIDLSEKLLIYTIERHYPEIKNDENKALSLLRVLAEKQTDLIVQWMRVGFIHGVMNTDNITLSGETIDYGPCAFMDYYNLETVFSSIDHSGRYAYGNQAKIIQWNLARFAESLLPLISDDINQAVAMAEEIINKFPIDYEKKWLVMMGSKLGINNIRKEDKILIDNFLDWMTTKKTDYTNTFIDLQDPKIMTRDRYNDEAFKRWYKSWKERIKKNCTSKEPSHILMKKYNPLVIPRNHIVEEALNLAQEGDLSLFTEFLDALRSPYNIEDIPNRFLDPPPKDQRVYQTFCGT